MTARPTARTARRTRRTLGRVAAGALALEPGYLQQRVARPGADRTDHVLSVSVFLRR